MDYAAARRNMVESQVRTNKVTDRGILDAMLTLPRESFVPKASQSLAYVDEDIAVAPGRYLMEPFVLGRLLQAAALQPSDVALVVGCSTGYAAAVVAQLSATVLAIESDADLASEAMRILAEQSIDNVVVEVADHTKGWPEQGPYDVILIDGAVADVPAAILDQLGEGGRLVTVVKQPEMVGRATLYGKRGGTVSHRALFDAAVNMVPGFEKEAGFVF